MQPTDDHNSTETIGTQHYILGVIEVTQQDPDLVTAKVLKSYRTIHLNDLLMPYVQESPKVVRQPSTPGIDGQIIISEDHTTLTGDNVLAFIDKGRNDNLEVGQQYDLYRQQKSDSGAIMPPISMGTFIVLHTEENTSTVVITDAVNNIERGERFRTPVE
ncbi:hypothetical protein [Desulfosarcina cetonica]|uniref:hypothetical protein n=1 Tax=Desulfosarcina cetonica TaxID=90730 RepID=UPI0006CF3444|nr:hypothetical protein [Desulfosarcina cetonica]